MPAAVFACRKFSAYCIYKNKRQEVKICLKI